MFSRCDCARDRVVVLFAGLCLAAGGPGLFGSELPEPATLRGSVLDGETGQPTACTVAIVDAAGRTVFERESFKAGFRSEGRFSKQLPAGRTRVRVTRGFETQSQEREVMLEAGRETAVVFRLVRLVDLRGAAGTEATATIICCTGRKPCRWISTTWRCLRRRRICSTFRWPRLGRFRSQRRKSSRPFSRRGPQPIAC